MIKINKHIEIVSSSRPGLSSMSAASRRAVRLALSKYYARVGITIVNDVSDLEGLVSKRPDVVFLGMKFLPVNPDLGQEDPDKIWLSDYLDENNISYTGSSQAAHELELDKSLAKQRVLDTGLKTSLFHIAYRNKPSSTDVLTLNYPVFIKPVNRGGGEGIDDFSVANNFEQMHAKVSSIALDLESDSLIENYLTGREFSVAILKNEETDDFSVMALELIAPLDKNGARLLSAAVKSADTETFVAVTDQAINSQVSELAINVFHALGARDYGRIDIRLDGLGVPHFLEANLLPSLLNGYGNFPKACLLNMNLDYEPMLLVIVRLALMRQRNIIQAEPELELPYILPISLEPLGNV